jgi:hypothetical protein
VLPLEHQRNSRPQIGQRRAKMSLMLAIPYPKRSRTGFEKPNKGRPAEQTPGGAVGAKPSNHACGVSLLGKPSDCFGLHILHPRSLLVRVGVGIIGVEVSCAAFFFFICDGRFGMCAQVVPKRDVTYSLARKRTEGFLRTVPRDARSSRCHKPSAVSFDEIGGHTMFEKVTVVGGPLVLSPPAVDLLDVGEADRSRQGRLLDLRSKSITDNRIAFLGVVNAPVSAIPARTRRPLPPRY